jgi:hypothetical protein
MKSSVALNGSVEGTKLSLSLGLSVPELFHVVARVMRPDRDVRALLFLLCRSELSDDALSMLDVSELPEWLRHEIRDRHGGSVTRWRSHERSMHVRRSLVSWRRGLVMWRNANPWKHGSAWIRE